MFSSLSPIKLAKYLIKTTIGKLIQDDFDWEQVEVQLLQGNVTALIQGTAILSNLQLNKSLLASLGSSGQVVSGSIAELLVSIPYATFLSESCQLSIRGITIT
ncbi:hypothetical protein HDU91_003962, partial [Kappamyces sp. JEL0680]